MAIYRTGTASMNANGVITGVGTKWQDKLSLIRVGATMVFLTQPLTICTISAIVSDTELRATQTDGKVVPAGTNYVILLHDSITVDGLAQDVAETLRYYQSKETVIEDAIEFFQNFDFDKYKETADQVKADAAAAAASQVAAKTSETNAKTSETNAKASETAAAASRTAAAASQTAAKTSETNAKTSETNANSSKVAAAASQTAAKTSETNAKTSETNAKTSETNAANSRTAAASSATAAAGSASSADVSKTAAATSAGQAAGSATAAAGSATAAAGSATTAKNEADRAKTEADRAAASNPDNSLKKAANLSDLADAAAAKDNLGLSFIIQNSSWSQMYAPASDGTLGRGDWAITISADGSWGARNKNNGNWKALTIGNGGTGASDASGARVNFQVDKLVQLPASTNLNYPTKNAALVLRDSDLAWGVYSNDLSKWLSLGVGQGGTGATDAAGARDNLQLGIGANPQFNSLIVQPQGSSGLSAIELRPFGSSGTYPKSTIYGLSDGTCQIHTYSSLNERKRYFFSDQIGNPTPNADRTIVTNGDFGLGAGVSSYATPANHGSGSAFIAGSSLGWMPGGAGIQASYDSARTGQLVIRANGSVVFRWVNNGNPESTDAAAPYTTLQNAGTSDINLKHVNGDLDVNVALENIENMEFKRFYYLSDEDKIERRGVIAQQIEEIDPEYVHSAEGTGKMTLDLNPLLMDCLAAIKALNAKISKLEEEVEKLKSAE